MTYGDPTPWDEWKKANENCDQEYGFKQFSVYRYVFVDSNDPDDFAFDLCGPHEDGSWTVESPDSENISFANSDLLIDFMLNLKLAPPSA